MPPIQWSISVRLHYCASNIFLPSWKFYDLLWARIYLWPLPLTVDFACPGNGQGLSSIPWKETKYSTETERDACCFQWIFCRLFERIVTPTWEIRIEWTIPCLSPKGGVCLQVSCPTSAFNWRIGFKNPGTTNKNRKICKKKAWILQKCAVDTAEKADAQAIFNYYSKLFRQLIKVKKRLVSQQTWSSVCSLFSREPSLFWKSNGFGDFEEKDTANGETDMCLHLRESAYSITRMSVHPRTASLLRNKRCLPRPIDYFRRSESCSYKSFKCQLGW